MNLNYKKVFKNVASLVNYLFVALLIVGLVVALNPEIEDHHKEITVDIDMHKENVGSSVTFFAPWDELEYKSYGLFSVIRTKNDKTTVTIGFVDTIFIVNHDWFKNSRNYIVRGSKILV